LAYLAGERCYAEAARQNLRWSAEQQLDNGWFRHAGFRPNELPFLHTIAYTTRGFLEAGILDQNEHWITIARRCCEALLARLQDDGFLPALWDADWRGLSYYSCLTGNAQIALQWLRLFQITGEQCFLEGACRTNRAIKTTQDLQADHEAIRGAVKGSHPLYGRYIFGGFPNWAAKFFLDSLLAHERARTDGTEGHELFRRQKPLLSASRVS
jgi:hypothetical protein